MATQTHADTNQALSLIEGKFTAEEAREQLLTLYEGNIRYHGSRNFASQIRLGNPDQYSVQKLEELTNAKSDAIRLLEFARKQGLKIKIESDVRVSLSED